jgi:hypothetical protein
MKGDDLMSDIEIADLISRFEYQLNLSSSNSHDPATISDVKNLAKATEDLFRVLAQNQD